MRFSSFGLFVGVFTLTLSLNIATKTLSCGADLDDHCQYKAADRSIDCLALAPEKYGSFFKPHAKSKCKIEVLSIQSFLNNRPYLNMQNNMFHRHFPHLKKFQLKFEKQSYDTRVNFPPTFFYGVEHLKNLQLENFATESLEVMTQLKNMEALYMSHIKIQNKIEFKFNQTFFNNFPQLSKLKLDFVEITNLDAFSNLHKMENLILNDLITEGYAISMNNSFIAMPNLKNLAIIKPFHVKAIAFNCTFNSSKINSIQFAYQSYERFSSYLNIRCVKACTINSLVIKYTWKLSWESFSIENVKELSQVTLDDTLPTSLKEKEFTDIIKKFDNCNLRKIVFKNSNIKILFPSSSFRYLCNNQPNLTELELNNFGSFSVVPANSFVNCSKLVTLNINQLNAPWEFIHNDAFNGLKSLKVVYLTNANLQRFPKQAFLKIPHIEELYLNESRLTFANLDFQSLKELRKVDISFVGSVNEVRSLKKLFHYLHKLEVLVARGYMNHLDKQNLTGPWFSDNYRLKHLDIGLHPYLFDQGINRQNRNAIEYVHYDDMLKNLTQLESLTIDNTAFGLYVTFEKSKIFQPVSKTLKYLNIKSSHMTWWSNNYRHDYMFNNLEVLEMSYNTISTIFLVPKTTFPKLKKINLFKNRLTHITRKALDYIDQRLPDLTTFLLAYNPFKCNCDLLPLANWTRNTKIFTEAEQMLCIKSDQDYKPNRGLDNYMLVSKFFKPILECYDNILKLASLILLVLFVLSAVSVLLIYIFIWPLRLQRILCRFWCVKTCNRDYTPLEDIRKVMVLYDPSDMHFIRNHLLPKMDLDDITREEIFEIEGARKITDFEKNLHLIARKSKLKLIIQHRDFGFGTPLVTEISSNILSCDFVLALCSVKFFENENNLFGTHLALHDMMMENRSKLVLFFLEDIQAEIRPPILQLPIRLLKQVFPVFEYQANKETTDLNKKERDMWIKLVLLLSGQHGNARNKW